MPVRVQTLPTLVRPNFDSGVFIYSSHCTVLTAPGEITCLQEQILQFQSEVKEKDACILSLRADHSAEMTRLRVKVHSLLDGVVCVRQELQNNRDEVREKCLGHSQLLKGLMRSERGRQEALQCRVDILQSQLVARQEAMYTLEQQLQER